MVISRLPSPRSRLDRSEFERLAFKHLNGVYRTALRMTRNVDDAADLTQETFLRAFRFSNRFRPGTSFRAWTHRILRNTYINVYRKKSREPVTVHLDEACLAGSELAGGAADRAAYEQLLADRLHAAVDHLPVEQRTILHLAYVEGFTYKEIARAMGWPLGTVMSRLHRTRRLLRHQLIRHTGEPAAACGG